MQVLYSHNDLQVLPLEMIIPPAGRAIQRIIYDPRVSFSDSYVTVTSK